MEPRILLSADLIASELYGSLSDDRTQDALVQEIDTADLTPQAETGPGIVLADWSVEIGDETAATSDEAVAVIATQPENSDFSDESSLPGTGSSLYISESVDDVWARGPPEYLQSVGPNNTPSLTVLQADELAEIVTAAISRWDGSELVPFGMDLSLIDFAIADLTAGILAEISASTITIDATADDFGWFIDATPDSDSEFTTDSLAQDVAEGIDLFTVVTHELGHAMGFAHPGEAGLQGVEVMVGTLGEGVRRVPQLADGTKLNDVLDVILATFDTASDPIGQFVFTSTTPLRLPNVVTVGETPTHTPDLQLEGLKLTFSELAYTSAWAGEVLVESQLGILMPGGLDIVVVDDDFATIRVETASLPVVVADGWSVTFTVRGPFPLLIGAGDEIGVANSNEAGFDDVDPADGKTITVSSSSYDLPSNTTTITVIYNFDPGPAAWTGGSVIMAKSADVTDDVDFDAVSGTLQLAPGNDTSLLNFESLEATDLGWPRFLIIQITDLKLEFNDFRVDDSDSHLRLDAAFRGLETGNAVTNQLVKTFLTVEGAANGLIFDMDRLAAGSRTAGGAVIFSQFPIVDISGVSGLIGGGIPLVGKIAAGFILKKVGIDEAGNLTTNTNEIEREAIYLAVKGVLEVGGKTPAGPSEKDGTPPAKVGGYGFGFNFAISELGPLQVFVYVDVPIVLDPVSGLAISSLRGGVRFNSTLEDLQVRPPFTATAGSAEASGDASLPVEITLTVPGHNLKPGDEFRITAAGDPDLLTSGPDHFVVLAVDGDNITYWTGASGSESDPNAYSFGGTIEVKKISISDPFDLRDPGFQSSKGLTLEQWEDQLDQQVVNQLNAGNSVWDVLFDKFVIEAGATLSFAPRIPSFLVSLDVDLLFDTELRLMITGQMVLLTALKFPVKIFGDFSEVGEGVLTLLALMDIPSIPDNALGIKPLVVAYAGITFESLINGAPASLDAVTGFPAGIGTDVIAATVEDLPGAGGGPWEVTYTLASGTDATSLFEVGDSIVVVGSQPDSFNGTYLVTAVTTTTVSFVIGSILLDGLVDVDRSGIVDASDNGILAGIPIIAGRLDINKDETIDGADDGEIFNVVRDAAGRRQVVPYAVINGYVDVDGDGLADGTDMDDDAVVGEDPRLWDHEFDLTRNIVDGGFDTDGNGIINDDDLVSLGDLRVIDGRADMNRDGTPDENDDGTLLNVVINAAGDRVVTSYSVIDGSGVIDGNDDLALDMASDLGGYWIRPGFKVANEDDLGDGLRMTVFGGLDLNIPFVTTLSLSGSAILDMTFGGASDVRLDLAIDMALSETHVGDIGHANGEFTVTMDVLGGPVVEGIPTPLVEFWGAAVLTSDFSFLEPVGLFADVSGVLVLNSTAADKPPILLNTTNGGTISIVPTAETFALRLDGSIDFRIDFNDSDVYEESEQVFLIAGIFVMSFTSDDGFNVALFSEPTPGDVGPATLRIGPASAPFLEFTAFGFLAIRENGIAANIILGFDASLGGPFTDFATASGQFVFMVNTTFTDISFNIPAGLDDRASGSDLTVMIPRAPPSSIADASLNVFDLIAGTAWEVPGGTPGAAYVLILLGGMDEVTNPDASVVVGNVFDLRGKFSLLLRVDAFFNVYVEMQFDAKMELQPLNGLLVVSGSLKINDAGVVGSLALGGELILEPLTIVGAFTLQINTTDADQVVQLYEFDFVTEQFKRNAGGQVVLQPATIAPNTISLFAFAKFKLTDSFVLQGSVRFTNDPDLLSLDLDMTMAFFDTQLSLDGGARIVKTGPSPGFVLRLSAALSAPVFGVAGIFDIDADLELWINTRPVGGSDDNDLGLARETYRVQVTNASVSLLSVVTLSGSGFVEVTQGVFRMEATLGGHFLSIFSVSATAFFSSEGEFSASLTGSVVLGTSGFNISGSANLSVSLLDGNGTDPFGSGDTVLNVSGSLTVSGTLFYIPLPAVTIGVTYNSATGVITVRAGPVPVPGIAWKEVDLGWLGSVWVPYPTITWKYFTFTIGTLKLGPPPSPADLAEIVNGQLSPNVGPDAVVRNLQVDEIDESVFIDAVGAGTVQGQKIKVTMFGTSQEYDNVTSIDFDMGDGIDLLQIEDTVTIPVTVHFGDGTDTLRNFGSAPVVAYGDGGDDLLLGGAGDDQLFGGDGQDTIEGGQGDDQVEGGADSDLLIWDVGDGSDSAINGQGDNDTLSIRGTDNPESVSITSSSLGFAISVGAETLIVDGVEVADIEGRGGSDTFTVNDLTSSALGIVNIQFGADNNPDTLFVNGSTGDDAFTVSAAVAVLTRGEEDGTVVVSNVDVLQLEKTMALTVNVFGATTSGGDLVNLDTAGGDDIIHVGSILAGAPTTVNGGTGSDSFNVGSDGSLTGLAATLTVNGNEPSSGSDVLNIDDSADTLGNTGAMTSTTITGLGLAPAGITYSGIEHLNISLGTGGDTFTIESTAVGAETTVTANDGGDVVNIRTISDTTTVDGGSGSDTFNVGSLAPALGGTVNGIDALLVLSGNVNGDVLNVDDSGDSGDNTGTLTVSTIMGLGMAGSISFGTIETVNVNLGSGSDTFDVESTSVVTTISTGTGMAANTVNVVHANNIGAVLTVIGQSAGDDTLNVDDTGDTTPNTGTLTATTLTGLGLADGIHYASIDTLNISLGSGGNTFNVQSTSALTTVNTGTGTANTVHVGSLAPATGGTVNNIAGKLVIHGQSTDSETLNVDDSGDSDSNSATLNSTRLTGLGMSGDDPAGGIEYFGVDTLNIYLGSGADSFTIEGTAAGTRTTLNDNGGPSIINVRAIAAPLTLNGGNGSNVFNLGSQAPATGGTVNGIAALLIINGNEPSSGSDVLNVDDSGDMAGNTGTLTSTTITGLGLSPAGIVYSGIEHLTISLGSGNDSFAINGTHGSATSDFQEETTLNMGPGGDTVAINHVTDLLFVNGEADGDTFNVNGAGAGSTSTLHGNDGNDVFNVRAMDGDVRVNGDAHDDTINVGTDAPALPSVPTTPQGTVDAINGLLTVDGGSGTNDVLNVDDSDAGNNAKSGALTASMIRGLELEQGIDYSNLDRLNIWLAFGDNTFNIESTHTGETTVNTAQGEDTVNIHDAAGLLVVNGEADADTVNVNGTGSGSVATLNGDEGDDVFNIRGMDGRVLVSGGAGNDRANVADTGQNLDQIQGALILEGGAVADSGTIDTLNVFHANNSDADSGRLFYRTMSSEGSAVANPGLALTGFGMGDDSGDYGGGITYNGFESVDVVLGSGDETLTIEDTGDADEKAAIEDDPAAITGIHGGGGNDTITISNRGNGPLVVYGDDGNDTIDASAMAAKSDPFVGIVIDGGADNDLITGTQDDDQLAGGSGSDTVNGEAGNDHIYGDSQFSVDLQLFAQDQQQRFDTDTELNLINAMFTVITTGSGDADTLNGGAGADVVFGDHGIIGQTEGTRRIESTGSVVLLQTVNLTSGGDDDIHGADGNDLIFGGAGGDTLYGDSDSDLIFGDFGTVAGDVDASAIGEVDGAGVQNPDADFTYTSDISAEADASAGDDTIYGGTFGVLDTDSGKNILLGQQGVDTIYGGGSDDDIYGGHNVANGTDTGDFIDGGAGNDVILGDNGLIEHTAGASDPRFTVLTGTRIYDEFGNPLVADGSSIGANPAGVEARRIALFDHDDSSTANAGNFGADTIAGGADDDVIFGQLGDDTIHGDGILVNGALATLAATVDDSDFGGDDYIEGNGGSDTVYGGLGQDDVAGGSSDLYGLIAAAMRPDGSDTIFGGNRDRTGRNDYGEGGHGLDSDAIVGDNGNILRLVGTGGSDGDSLLTFAYDNYGGVRIVVRAVQLLDYTPGGPDYSNAALFDIGGADEIHGESGDDFIYGQKGSDVLFGDAQDDDIIAGYGNDWVSGGTGDDGVIGDDGRIYTSRNGTAEPLNGVVATTEAFISTPGDFQQATINVTGQLKKSVDMTPFSQDPDWAATADEFGGISNHTSDDILFGGLGNDWLHGGSGADAISGAEALPGFYSAPSNPGNALGYSPATGTFAAFDEFAPMTRIDGFFLNFDEGDGPVAFPNVGTVYTDGDDKIFGDPGNDWLVGGTGRDDLYGGWGNDLMNADDDQTTNGYLNDEPDTQPTYEDRAFGGAGRDVLIANTEGDRLIDWAGQFNTYIVPFSQSGMGTISRTLQPQLAEFLYALSLSDGADPTRAADTGADPVRNGEPFGELGVVRQQDFAWQDQTGAEPEMLLGVIPEGKREVLRSATFNGPQSTTAGGFSTAEGFSPDSGTWRVANGALQVSADSPAGDAVSVFDVGDVLPGYFEVQASVLAIKPTGGWNANSFIIFDYVGENDFKFAGIDVSTNKLVMGHRDAGGWHVDEQASVQGGLKADKYYNMLLAVNGSNATLVVDNQMVFTHTYQPRVVEGYSYGLNWGLVGVGSNNARGVFDNIQVQILPPQLTFDQTEDFEGEETLSFRDTSGLWNASGGVYTSTSAGTASLSLIDLGADSLAYSSYLELSALVTTDGLSGFVFDRYEDGSFKFAVIDTDSGEAIIGHYTTKSGWVYDAVVSVGVNAGTAYTLGVVLKGTTVSLTLDGQTILGYSFNASVVDGGFGLMTVGGTASFDNVRVKTNDKKFAIEVA